MTDIGSPVQPFIEVHTKLTVGFDTVDYLPEELGWSRFQDEYTGLTVEHWHALRHTGPKPGHLFDDRSADRNPRTKNCRGQPATPSYGGRPPFTVVVAGRAVPQQLSGLHIPLAKASDYSDDAAALGAGIRRMSLGDVSRPLFGMQVNNSKAHVAPNKVPACEQQNKTHITPKA